MKEIIIKKCEATNKWDLVIDGELKGKHYKLRELTKQLNREAQEDYSEEELKEYLRCKGYSYDKFQEYMKGQTVGFHDGGVSYYSYDVERYKE